MITATEETIFTNDITEQELSALNLNNIDAASYLQKTNHIKRLSDLHLLFIMRKDKTNRQRIISKIALALGEE